MAQRRNEHLCALGIVIVVSAVALWHDGFERVVMAVDPVDPEVVIRPPTDAGSGTGSFEFALGPVSAQAERLVDLTPKTGGEAGEPTIREQLDCRGRGTGRIGPAPTLSLTITGLDSREYSMGGQIVADIRVKNVGKAPVVLPSVLTQDFGGGFSLPPYAIEASIGISGIDAQGREHGLSGTVLRGSPSRFGTTESLEPGESVTFRFPGGIIGVDGPSAPATGEAKLFASLILRDNECRDWQRVTSQRVDIWLRGRE